MAQVLLEAHTPVDRDKRLALPSEPTKQRSIVEVGASEQPADGRDVVSWQKPSQPRGHTRIKDDAHRGRLRRAGFGLADEGLPREFQDGNRVFARDVREVRKKLGELMPTLDVVHERAHRHASACEAGLAAEACGARRDQGARERHGGQDNRSPVVCLTRVELTAGERAGAPADRHRRTTGARSGVGGSDARLCERSEQPEGERPPAPRRSARAAPRRSAVRVAGPHWYGSTVLADSAIDRLRSRPARSSLGFPSGRG